ncbi:hypothetical protein AB0B60_33965 [Streptomyces lincolnensis]|uniref:hypothetical protein n=1 Tax=Streptomyces lincolnensis TaxID=1915 RepID=UPI000833F273|nr:hypothetical protein [Streptomyces lincolnensis]
MGIRAKLGAVAAAVGTVMIAAAPASAGETTIKRTCDGRVTQYDAYSSRTLAYTQKTGTSCDGHAWVRVKTNGTWKNWLHNNDKATIANSTGNFQASQHKGCADCKVYTLTP